MNICKLYMLLIFGYKILIVWFFIFLLFRRVKDRIYGNSKIEGCK